jgi:thiamine biosynthesis lipoprotein
MGTIVNVDVVVPPDDAAAEARADRACERALAQFDDVESACSRFDERSELRRLCERVGSPVRVSPLLFETLAFAIAVAEASGGAFDPTVGRVMAARGFNREHRTGVVAVSETDVATDISFRDIELDAAARTISLRRPLLLDLGAVAKGLAIDLAARELRCDCEDFAIDAGGDLYAAGRNLSCEPWAIGIRHPRQADAVIDVVRLSGAAVCTSGDYERRSPIDDGSHLVDGRRRGERHALDAMASVTVIAASAMVADALATAAFALGADEGRAFLEAQGVDGLLVSSSLDRTETSGFSAHTIR